MTDPDGMLEALLQMSGGAEPHLYGDLRSHLRGVWRLLVDWNAGHAVQRAGLCHAAYGTDGFPHALLSLDRRHELAALIGAEAEILVYLYAACDRRSFRRTIASANPVSIRDRFIGVDRVVSAAELNALCGITLANELELCASSQDHWRRFGADLSRLFAAPGFLSALSPPARMALACL